MLPAPNAAFHNGRPTAQGGSILRPDLATALPEVSQDGLTWTFRIKRGIHYAPPLRSTEVLAEDFIRALEREGNPAITTNGYAIYYEVIRGFTEYEEGKADSIAGLQAPDAHTLVVHLTEPTGDLGHRLAMPAAGPIPPNPVNPGAALEAATGHDKDYGRFLVSTGPYMFQGSGALDFSGGPGDQKPAPGYVPGKSITLVRNPSWRAATDALRPAFPEAIDITIGGTPAEAASKVDAGRADLVVDSSSPSGQVERYLADPRLRNRVFVDQNDFVLGIIMDSALPPFDDVDVRKAASYTIDKQALLELYRKAPAGSLGGAG